MNNYTRIAERISDVRLLLNNVSLNTDNVTDKTILSNYYELVEFVVDNFEIPDTHVNYITDSLKVSSSGKSEIINELKYNYANTEGYFGIEIPLRGIESFFNWATDKEKEIEFEKIQKVKYLVSKLHSDIGNKYFQNP